jgi:branched-subunit amino acid aminotransferase/4-amino-4-deoxychorismate lyase
VEGHLVESRLNEHAATAGIKTISYLESVLAQREAFERGAHEAIRLNTAGALAEGAVSNLFLVRDGGLATPGLQCGALPGITRQLVLELAYQAGVAADGNAVLHPHDLANADEAFLTNSLREIVPLVKLDGAAIGDGRPGSVTLSLLDSYRGMVDEITKPVGGRPE